MEHSTFFDSTFFDHELMCTVRTTDASLVNVESDCFFVLCKNGSLNCLVKVTSAKALECLSTCVHTLLGVAEGSVYKVYETCYLNF